jgi:hypothetical protein
MVSKRAARISVSFLVGLLAVVPLASAQQASGIAGLVRDTSGAVMPGVTVEASSPALIEKVRSVATDAEGRYNIVDLRRGTYTITFSLAGFSTFKTIRCAGGSTRSRVRGVIPNSHGCLFH